MVERTILSFHGHLHLKRDGSYSRSRLYELLSEGKIRSISVPSWLRLAILCVKSHKGAERGVRLLDRESVDSFMLALLSDTVPRWD